MQQITYTIAQISECDNPYRKIYLKLVDGAQSIVVAYSGRKLLEKVRQLKINDKVKTEYRCEGKILDRGQVHNNLRGIEIYNIEVKEPEYLT